MLGLCSILALAACAAEAPGWRFDVEPYVWLPSTSGTGSTDTTPELDVDLVGTLDAAFPLAIGARSPDGELVVLVDGLYARLEDDEGSLRTTTEATMIEGGVGVALDERKRWSAMLGLRYVDVEYDVGLGTLSGTADARWVDPWVGVRGVVPFDETWAMRLRGDVGGFGVGSDFTWQALVLLAVTLGDGVAIDVGYRAIALDFEDDDLAYDVVFHGPIIGLALSF